MVHIRNNKIMIEKYFYEGFHWNLNQNWIDFKIFLFFFKFSSHIFMISKAFIEFNLIVWRRVSGVFI